MPDILWAPWRMTYIEKPSTGSAEARDIFVDLPAQEDDAANLILFRGETSFVMLNAFPYTTGHMLVAPYRQVADLPEMNDAELFEVNRLLAKAVTWVRLAYKPDGYNVGINQGRAAGAGIPQHIHWHLVPRWNGDTNFMTTVGAMRVMPQTLQDSYLRLREVIGQ